MSVSIVDRTRTEVFRKIQSTKHGRDNVAHRCQQLTIAVSCSVESND